MTAETPDQRDPSPIRSRGPELSNTANKQRHAQELNPREIGRNPYGNTQQPDRGQHSLQLNPRCSNGTSLFDGCLGTAGFQL